MVKTRIEGGPDPQRKVILRTPRVSIVVKTWSEIIDDNLARLQFIAEAL